MINASSNGLRIGGYVHLSAGVTILGREHVTIEDFVALSAHVCVFTSNADYTSGGIVNPTVPEEFRRVESAPVVFRRHTVVGAGSVVLPGVTTGVGAAIGALSFVKHSVDDFTVVAGRPARKVGERSKTVLDQIQPLSESCLHPIPAARLR